MAAMLAAGKLIGRIDTRILLAAGLALTAWSFYAMTGWTPDVAQATVVIVGVIQGVGLGLLFTPLSVVTLSTLSPEHRAEGAGLFSLSRNVGSSVGISVVNSLLTTNTQINHADIVQHVTAVNRVFEHPTIAQFWNPLTAAGRAALDAVVTQQAQIIAYIDDYKLLMIATLVVIRLSSSLSGRPTVAKSCGRCGIDSLTLRAAVAGDTPHCKLGRRCSCHLRPSRRAQQLRQTLGVGLFLQIEHGVDQRGLPRLAHRRACELAEFGDDLLGCRKGLLAAARRFLCLARDRAVAEMDVDPHLVPERRAERGDGGIVHDLDLARERDAPLIVNRFGLELLDEYVAFDQQRRGRRRRLSCAAVSPSGRYGQPT